MRQFRMLMGIVAAAVLVAGPLSAQDAPKDPAAGSAKTEKPAAKESAGGGAKIGETAPDFELTGADGKKYKLADFKDKIVVLQWCNKDCPFCVKAAPKLKETADKYMTKGVVWLAIDSTASHKPEDGVAYIKQEKFGFPILMDQDGTVGKAYGAKTTPHIFIIEKGKLVYKGAHDDRKEKAARNYIEESLDALLAGKQVPVAETESYGCSVKYKK